MSEAIKKSDIIEGNPFTDIAKDIAVAENALKDFDAKIIQLSTHLGKDLKNASTQTVQGIEAINKAEIESQKLLQAKLDTEKKVIQLSEIKRKAMDAEQKAHERKEKAYNREIQQAEKASSLYAKVDAKLANMVKSYRELAIRKELTGKLTDKEQKQYDFLANKIQKYDSALKAVDAQSGKHQRNVGNYKSAFDGLGFSVTQLTRELPAFGNSMQTGFMAISNNLPMFFDEIMKLKQANIELAKSGEPTKSVFKQLAGSLMSTQVLLSVGVTLLTLYGAKLIDYVSGLFDASKAEKEHAQAVAYANKQRKESSKFVAEESAEFIGNINALRKTVAGSKERATMIDEINKKYGTTLKNLKDEKAFTDQLNDSVGNYLKLQIENYRQKQNQQKIERNLQTQDKLRYNIQQGQKDMLKLTKELTLAQKEYNSATNGVNVTGGGSMMGTGGQTTYAESFEDRLNKIKNAIAETKKNLVDWNNELDAAQKRLLTYDVNIKDNTKATDANSNSKANNTKETKDLNTELDKTNEYLSTQNELLNEIEQIKAEIKASEYDQQIKDELRQQTILAEQTGRYSIEFLKDLLLKKREIQIQAIDEQNKFELSQIKEKYRLETQEEIDEAKKKRDELLAQEGLTATQKESINKQYDENLAQIENNRFQRDADYELEAKKREIRIGEQKVNINKGINDELQSMSDDLASKAEEKRKKDLEAEKAHKKELLDDAMHLQDAITEYLKEQVDKRIDLMQREADHAKQMQDYMQNLAQNGNIYAQQSIAEQIQAQRDAQREIMRLQKEKANIEAISAGLKTFTSEIDKGKNPAQALASTLVNTTVLVNLLKNLSFFAKGTSYAPEGLAVVDEQGAELITDKSGNIKQLGSNGGSRFTWLNKGDKVYTATQTADIFESVGMANRLNTRNTSVSNSDYQLLKELKAVRTSIENKPENSVNWQTFASGFAEIVSQTKANGVTTTNRFRVR